MQPKKCTKCGKEYPATAEYFYKQKGCKDGLQPQCKECIRIKGKKYRKQNHKRIADYSQTYHKKHKEKLNKYNRDYHKQHYVQTYWKHHLKKYYNMTPDDYNKLFDNQRGCCAICGKHQSNIERKLFVDHSHLTGQVRGLLCFNCNAMLGNAKDNPDFLISAVDYLNNFS